MNIVLIGAPGAGKGSVANMLVEKYGYKHISTGNLLRKHIQGKTVLGNEAKKYIDKGLLVPNDIVIELLKNAIKYTPKVGYILDGFPRNLEQAQQLKEFFKIDCVIDVEIPFDVIVSRLTARRTCPNCHEIYSTLDYSSEFCEKCNTKIIQRSDDTKEVIEKRLEVYKESTKPLIDFYKNENLLFKVDNSKTLESTFEQVEKVINMSQRKEI